MRKRAIIGVIGGGNQETLARAVGAEISCQDQILLTGGTPAKLVAKVFGGLIDSSEVKFAAIDGACDAEVPEHRVSRFIGILLGGIPEDLLKDSNRHRLLYRTGLSGISRDPINGLTPDVLIVFSGGTGTLLELAYAATAKKPLLFAQSVIALKDKLTEHRKDGKLRMFLDEATQSYPTVNGQRIGHNDLDSLLECTLKCSEDFNGSPKELVVQAKNNAIAKPLSEESGFPGLPGITHSKERFEKLLKALND